MKKYTFRSLAMLGEMYIGDEEAGVKSGTDFYVASEVDIREQQATAMIQAQRRKIERLENALKEAIESVEHWGGYASEYFQEKHDLAGNIDRLRDVLQPVAGDK